MFRAPMCFPPVLHFPISFSACRSCMSSPICMYTAWCHMHDDEQPLIGPIRMYVHMCTSQLVFLSLSVSVSMSLLSRFARPTRPLCTDLIKVRHTCVTGALTYTHTRTAPVRMGAHMSASPTHTRAHVHVHVPRHSLHILTWSRLNITHTQLA